jgi:hypothetical protein
MIEEYTNHETSRRRTRKVVKRIGIEIEEMSGGERMGRDKPDQGNNTEWVHNPPTQDHQHHAPDMYKVPNESTEATMSHDNISLNHEDSLPIVLPQFFFCFSSAFLL